MKNEIKNLRFKDKLVNKHPKHELNPKLYLVLWKQWLFPHTVLNYSPLPALSIGI